MGRGRDVCVGRGCLFVFRHGASNIDAREAFWIVVSVVVTPESDHLRFPWWELREAEPHSLTHLLAHSQTHNHKTHSHTHVPTQAQGLVRIHEYFPLLSVGHGRTWRRNKQGPAGGGLGSKLAGKRDRKKELNMKNKIKEIKAETRGRSFGFRSAHVKTR